MNLIKIPEAFKDIVCETDIVEMVRTKNSIIPVLYAHFALEALIDRYCNVVTGSDDLFNGKHGGYLNVDIQFATKVAVAINLGLDDKVAELVCHFNSLRNKVAHIRNFEIPERWLKKGKLLTDSIQVQAKSNTVDADKFELTSLNSRKRTTWDTGNSKDKFTILAFIAILRLTWWIQEDLKHRDKELRILPDHLEP